jgi:hypothetical protein
MQAFLSDEIFSLTLAATVQRTNVYEIGLLERDRKPFGP